MENESLIIRYIETTGRCNLNCPICVDRVRNYDMSLEDLYNIIGANKDILYGNRTWLDFNGEPLIDSSFFEKVKMLKEVGVIPMISTNGLMLNDENCKKLVLSGIDYLVVSISTLDHKLYHKMRGIDAHRIVIENIKKLKQYTDMYHSQMQIQAVAIDTGNLDVNSFVDYFHSLSIHAAVHNYTNRSMHSRMFFEVAHKKIERGQCIDLRQNIGILCDLNIVTCCCDFMGDNSLGNLRDYNYSVEKLIANGKLDQLLDKLKRHIYEGACENCSDWIYHQASSEEEYVTVYPLPGSNIR